MNFRYFLSMILLLLYMALSSSCTEYAKFNQEYDLIEKDSVVYNDLLTIKLDDIRGYMIPPSGTPGGLAGISCKKGNQEKQLMVSYSCDKELNYDDYIQEEKRWAPLFDDYLISTRSFCDGTKTAILITVKEKHQE